MVARSATGRSHQNRNCQPPWCVLSGGSWDGSERPYVIAFWPRPIEVTLLRHRHDPADVLTYGIRVTWSRLDLLRTSLQPWDCEARAHLVLIGL
jgi:hypothetical protein